MNRFQIRLRQSAGDRGPTSSRSPTLPSVEDMAQSRRSISRMETVDQSSRFDVGESVEESLEEEIEPNEALESAMQEAKGGWLWQWARSSIRNLLEPISPYSTVSRFRNAALVAFSLAYAVVLPLEIAFTATIPTWCDTVGDAFDAMLLVDFLLMFNTSFVEKDGSIVSSRQAIAWQYFKGWFLPDFLSSIPIHWLRLITDQNCDWCFFAFDILVRFERVVHILLGFRLAWFAYVGRSGKSIWAWFLYSRYSYLIRITWIIGLVLLLTHYMACFWKMLTAKARSSDVFINDYAASFYDALQLLQGQGLATHTVEQNVFASFAVLVGSLVLAIVFGHVAMLVSNFNANTTNYQRKMESVFAIMTKMQLPLPLRERIHQYYEHLWREYESQDGENVRFSKDLTHNLALEVVLFKYMVLVMHVPFWRDCSADFQKQIALHLQVRVYLPDDFIIRRGEVGDEFYIINHGVCEVAHDSGSFEHGTLALHRSDNADDVRVYSLYDSARYNGNLRERAPSERDQTDTPNRSPTRLTELNRGQAFGEIALLMNYERTANVRAVSYVEMCVLTRNDFHEVVKRYPIDRRHVITQILTRFMDQNEAHRGFCPLKDLVCSVMYEDNDDNSLSNGHAALLVAEVIDPKLEDETVRFSIDSKLLNQLSVLKLSPDPALSSALEARLGQIEETQSQTLHVVQEVLRAVEELKQGQGASRESLASPLSQARNADPKPQAQRDGRQFPIHPRRGLFIGTRSTSVPNGLELQARIASTTDMKEDKERRLSVSKDLHSTLKPGKHFFERLGQFGSVAKQSPTLYADQLFRPRPTASTRPD